MPKKIDVKGTIITDDEKWIYDLFEIENVSPKDIYNALPTDNSPVEVIINSPGGYVTAGSEIYTALKEYKGEVTTKIVGMAASAASVIAMAGNNVLMSPTAQMMIHNVSGGAWGDHRDLQHEADVLKNYNISIANAYALKTGKSHDELLNLMDNETYFTAQQALENGLVDEIMFENQTPKAINSLENGVLPQNFIDKIRNLKGKMYSNSIENEPETDENEQKNEELESSASTVEENNEQDDLEQEKQNLLLEIELI